jgi:hypothetical protein
MLLAADRAHVYRLSKQQGIFMKKMWFAQIERAVGASGFVFKKSFFLLEVVIADPNSESK